VLAPVLIDLLGNRGALAVTGTVIPLVALLAWPRLRALDSVAAPPQHVDLLRSISIFRPLPVPTVEQLAGELRPMRFAAGEDVIRQGDRGDRFYIVSDGEAEVRVDGRPVEPLHAGEFFGEIALLRDVPRTATVSARSDLELLTLERDAFLSAVTGHPESADAAQAVVASRVGSLPSREPG
jgi:CRP-like cAMP-binding protein